MYEETLWNQLCLWANRKGYVRLWKLLGLVSGGHGRMMYRHLFVAAETGSFPMWDAAYAQAKGLHLDEAAWSCILMAAVRSGSVAMLEQVEELVPARVPTARENLLVAAAFSGNYDMWQKILLRKVGTVNWLIVFASAMTGGNVGILKSIKDLMPAEDFAKLDWMWVLEQMILNGHLQAFDWALDCAQRVLYMNQFLDLYEVAFRAGESRMCERLNQASETAWVYGRRDSKHDMPALAA